MDSESIRKRSTNYLVLVIGAVLAWIRYIAITFLGISVEDVPTGSVYYALSGIMFATSLILLVNRNLRASDILMFVFSTIGLLTDMFFPTYESLLASTAYFTVAGILAFFANLAVPERHPTLLNWTLPLFWFTLLLLGASLAILRLAAVLFFNYPIQPSLSPNLYFLIPSLMVLSGLGLIAKGGRREGLKNIAALLAIVGACIELSLYNDIGLYGSTALYVLSGAVVYFRLSLVRGGIVLD